MYVNSAYLNNDRSPIVDLTTPLLVSSCGTYRMVSRPVMTTRRPDGRRDYQLLYVASGKTHFVIDGQEQLLAAGSVILFRPGQPQLYSYYAQEQPEVFWVHFTGNDVEELLESRGFGHGQVFFAGALPEFSSLFRHMIRELQLCRPGYQELLICMLRQLLLLLERQLAQKTSGQGTQAQIAQSVLYFHENYNRSIVIEEYARGLHMSVSWFIRGFKEYTGLTPTQYILRLRMENARSLLEETGYNVSEVAAVVGYDNALYFSRLFKKHFGKSPAHFRKSWTRNT